MSCADGAAQSASGASQLASGATGLFDGNRLNDHVAANPRRTMGEGWLEGSGGVLRLDGVPYAYASLIERRGGQFRVVARWRGRD